MIRVLIVEDQKMAQENIEAIIKASKSYILSGIISNAADAELEAALVDAGVIEDEAPSAVEKALTEMLRKMNQSINKMFG